MKNLVLPIICCLFFFACKDDEDCCTNLPEIPECIQEKIDAEATSLQAVYWVNSIEGGDYWFNTGAVAFDGAEYIFSAQCDTVCFFCGECDPPVCLDNYPAYASEDWELVWEP